MKLGQYELSTISGGRYVIDGGTMFGVVPKALWSRFFPVDENNNIRQATSCVLVETGSKRILIDTGYGSKLHEKQRRVLEAEEGDPLERSLAARGLTFADIDIVVFSHLHFDHAGGATRMNEAGELVTTFPNAEYVAQLREWIAATAGYPELRTAYPQDNLLPLKESGQLRLVDGDVEVAPGIHAQITGGHTHAHSILWIESEGQQAVYLADLVPTTRHLPTLWGMGYDVDMIQLRRKKPEVLGRIARENALALFDHDPDFAAARLTPDARRDFAVIETLDTV